jgi:hypothetical protein
VHEKVEMDLLGEEDQKLCGEKHGRVDIEVALTSGKSKIETNHG